MALTETTNNSERKESKPPERKEKPLTKVIVRRLPPNMDQETFLNQVSPIPDYNYIYSVKGDSSLGENAFSRVYINFVCPEDVYNFKERFDNYVFLNQKGQEYPAVVEFSAFQKIPKKRNKNRIDTKCGTIESDPLYQEFIENINKPQEQDEKPEYTLQLNSDNKNDVVSTTPLLEYIKSKRAQRMRIREVRREERKRREIDRKKNTDDRRKYEEKSPLKNIKGQHSKTIKENKVENDEKSSEKLNTVEEKSEKSYDKPSSYYKTKDKKYEEQKRKDVKSKYSTPRKDYGDKREYKRNDDFRSKSDDFKKEDTKSFPKKVKKYSEKREERKIEAQKAEQKKLELSSKEVKDAEVTEEQSKSEKETVDKQEDVVDLPKKESKHVKVKETCDNSSALQKRIRNKDRPTIAIYRPGMLSKRKQTEGESEGKDGK